MIRHILFPVDFSESCSKVAPVVRHWAEHFRAQVTLLHVFQGMGMLVVDHPPIEAELSFAQKVALKKLNGFLAAELDGLDVKRVQLSGEPGAIISEYAAANHVDLIVMPTMGYTRFRQILLGSVTASVLHDSEVPVWTSAHVAVGAEVKAPKQILCAVDCGPETANVVRWGQSLAKEFGATLKVIHSRPAIAKQFDSGIARSAHRLALSTAREEYGAVTSMLENVPELEILEDSTLVDGVSRIVSSDGIDLLVVGRGRVQGFMGRLRSNAHDLIRMSGCAVISV